MTIQSSPHCPVEELLQRVPAKQPAGKPDLSIRSFLLINYTDAFFDKSGVSFNDSNKRTLKLITADGYYTNAALLLSDQCEHSIKCAVYDGIGKTTFQSRKEFSGSVLKQMDDAYAYISLSNKFRSTFEGLRRVEAPDYPEYAIREALSCLLSA